MNRNSAMKKDKSVYVEKDNGSWCVFGEHTGFCYAEYAAKRDADDLAVEFNETLTNKKSKK